jgi:hypothetical protein
VVFAPATEIDEVGSVAVGVCKSRLVALEVVGAACVDPVFGRVLAPPAETESRPTVAVDVRIELLAGVPAGIVVVGVPARIVLVGIGVLVATDVVVGVGERVEGTVAVGLAVGVPARIVLVGIGVLVATDVVVGVGERVEGNVAVGLASAVTVDVNCCAGVGGTGRQDVGALTAPGVAMVWAVRVGAAMGVGVSVSTGSGRPPPVGGWSQWA